MAATIIIGVQKKRAWLGVALSTLMIIFLLALLATLAAPAERLILSQRQPH